jgi:hypothetical protein
MPSRFQVGCTIPESQDCCGVFAMTTTCDSPRKTATAARWLFALLAQWVRLCAAGRLLGGWSSLSRCSSGFFSFSSVLGFVVRVVLGFVHWLGFSGSCGRSHSRRCSWGCSRRRWRLRKSTKGSDDESGSDKRLFEHFNFSGPGEIAMPLQPAGDVIRLQSLGKPT